MSSALGAWVQAEKMMQIALTLPCAVAIGWLLGAGLDHWLHQKWMVLAGILFGIVAGLIGVIRMAMAYASDPSWNAEDKNGNSGQSAAPPGDSDKAS